MRYKIYAGLGGSFGGAEYQGTYDFRDREEALSYAYEIAMEEYASYGGMHGLMDWDGAYADCLESGWIDEDTPRKEVEEIVYEHYLECMESWLDFYIEEASLSHYEEEGDSDYIPDDDDADCFCD